MTARDMSELYYNLKSIHNKVFSIGVGNTNAELFPGFKNLRKNLKACL